MAVGQEVKKWTWLLDRVEVKGIVGGTPGQLVGNVDAFGVIPDENYKHLISFVPGSTGWGVWCETYPENITINPNDINRVEEFRVPWGTYKQKPDFLNYQGGTDKTFRVEGAGGELLLAANAITAGGIGYFSGAWTVTVDVITRPGQPLPDFPRGTTFSIADQAVSTGIFVEGGSLVKVTCIGQITFRRRVGQYYVLETFDADGDTTDPAPGLRRNSLICRIPVIFEVWDKGHPKALKCGDHVRLVGRWVIENGHLQNTHMHGWLKVGFVFVEFHPFDYKNIQLVTTLEPWEEEVEMISVVAPLYEEIYPGKNETWAANTLAGVANRIFIGNYHDTVTANAHIKAPPLRPGFTSDVSLIGFDEEILLNGTGHPKEEVRSITVLPDSIQVVARVQGSDMNGPANNMSVFQALYRVWWKARLKADAYKEVTVQTVPGIANFQTTVWNDGPDAITITGYEITPPEAQSVFRIDTPPSQVNGHSGIRLDGTFSPTRQMLFSGRLVILSNDPSGRHPAVQLKGIAGSPANISVSPSDHDFGRVPLGDAAEVTFEIRNIGVRALHILDISTLDPNSGFSISESPSTTINPSQSGVLTVLFRPTERRPYPASTITIRSDADNESELHISLRGEGIDVRCAEIDQELAQLRQDLNDPSLPERERAAIIRQIQTLENLKRNLGCP